MLKTLKNQIKNNIKLKILTQLHRGETHNCLMITTESFHRQMGLIKTMWANTEYIELL